MHPLESTLGVLRTIPREATATTDPKYVILGLFLRNLEGSAVLWCALRGLLASSVSLNQVQLGREHHSKGTGAPGHGSSLGSYTGGLASREPF